MLCATHILSILTEAYPNGMPVRRIALNVYNITNTLFEPQDPERIYAMVAEWLREESAKRDGLVVRTTTKGWYRLNGESPQAQQMLFDFQPHDEDDWMR